MFGSPGALGLPSPPPSTWSSDAAPMSLFYLPKSTSARGLAPDESKNGFTHLNRSFRLIFFFLCVFSCRRFFILPQSFHVNWITWDLSCPRGCGSSMIVAVPNGTQHSPTHNQEYEQQRQQVTSHAAKTCIVTMRPPRGAAGDPEEHRRRLQSPRQIGPPAPPARSTVTAPFPASHRVPARSRLPRQGRCGEREHRRRQRQRRVQVCRGGARARQGGSRDLARYSDPVVMACGFSKAERMAKEFGMPAKIFALCARTLARSPRCASSWTLQAQGLRSRLVCNAAVYLPRTRAHYLRTGTRPASASTTSGTFCCATC